MSIPTFLRHTQVVSLIVLVALAFFGLTASFFSIAIFWASAFSWDTAYSVPWFALFGLFASGGFLGGTFATMLFALLIAGRLIFRFVRRKRDS